MPKLPVEFRDYQPRLRAEEKPAPPGSLGDREGARVDESPAATPSSEAPSSPAAAGLSDTVRLQGTTCASSDDGAGAPSPGPVARKRGRRTGLAAPLLSLEERARELADRHLPPARVRNVLPTTGLPNVSPTKPTRLVTLGFAPITRRRAASTSRCRQDIGKPSATGAGFILVARSGGRGRGSPPIRSRFSPWLLGWARLRISARSSA